MFEVLLAGPPTHFTRNEIIRFARAGVGGVVRELDSLERAGIIECEPSGNQIAYIHGPMADGTAGANTDVDLTIVAEGLAYDDALAVLSRAGKKLRRHIEFEIVTALEHYSRPSPSPSPAIAVMGSLS